MITMKAKRLLWLLTLFVLVGCPVYDNGPGPAPEPKPSPLPVDSLKILIIEESAERNKLTRGQLNMISSTTLRSKIKELDGEFLILDQHVKMEAGRVDEWIMQAFALERKSLPWLIIAGPKGAWIGPLLESTDEIIKHAEEVK